MSDTDAMSEPGVSLVDLVALVFSDSDYGLEQNELDNERQLEITLPHGDGADDLALHSLTEMRGECFSCEGDVLRLPPGDLTEAPRQPSSSGAWRHAVSAELQGRGGQCRQGWCATTRGLAAR